MIDQLYNLIEKQYPYCKSSIIDPKNSSILFFNEEGLPCLTVVALSDGTFMVYEHKGMLYEKSRYAI